MGISIISVTDAAEKYLESVMMQGYAGIRVSVKTGGCSGSKYIFEYAREKKSFDEEVKLQNASLFIDPTAIIKVIGSTLDYQKDMFSEELVFVNPNEKSKCGCGKSVEF